MQHRHLNHEDFRLAAIDDIIERGGRRDWSELRKAAESDAVIAQKIRQICEARTRQDNPQRHRLWLHYVEKEQSRLG